MKINDILSLVLGILIVGEAILLFIDIYLLSKKHNEWKTTFNNNTLLMDIAFGTLIIGNSFEKISIIIVGIVVLIITHLYREIEYIKKDKKDKFIFNLPLFIINSIKLIGLIALLFLV